MNKDGGRIIPVKCRLVACGRFDIVNDTKRPCNNIRSNVLNDIKIGVISTQPE